MARDAVLTLLRNDTQLATLGGTGFVIEANFSGDQRPNDKGAFIVIRWGVTDKGPAAFLGPQHFDLWVHLPVAVSTDYVRIDDLIDRCDALFATANDDNIIGADGRTLDLIAGQGRGGDQEDQGYETICRRASYYALAHKP